MPLHQGVRTKIETPRLPFEWIQIDLVAVSNVPSDLGYRYLLTSVCTLTNFWQMRPIKTKGAIDVVDALCDIFYCSGTPKICQSDNGKEFAANITQNHAKWLNIEWRFSTPYKPSTNGRVERKHSDLGMMLKVLQSNKNTWDKDIPLIQFEMNSRIDSKIGMSPFEAFHGWKPRIPHVLSEVTTSSDDISFQEWAPEFTKQSWEFSLREKQKCFENLHAQRDAYKQLEELASDITEQLVPGDHVMVKLPGSGKLIARLNGPFEVKRVFPGGSFEAVEVGGSKVVKLPANHARRYKPNTDNLDTKIELGLGTNIDGTVKYDEISRDQSPEVINKNEQLKDEVKSYRKSARHQTKVDYTPYL